jgi:hypothetical protein
MSFDENPRERLGEEIGRHDGSGTVVDADGLLLSDLVSNPEFVQGDVLHATVLHRVVQDLDGGHVVDMEGRWAREGTSEFAEKLL